MSVENIFRQLSDRASWPPPPPRVLQPASVHDLRPFNPADLIPATLIPVREETLLQRWTPDLEDGEG